MAISDEDFRRSMELKRAAMLHNQEQRRSALECASKPTPAMIRRKEQEQQVMEARLRILRGGGDTSQGAEPIDLDSLA